MLKDLTRREFIKTAAMGFFAAAAYGVLPETGFAAGDCRVKTRYGTFNGFVDQNGVKTWLGIPYAKPPVEKLRWQLPQPLKPSNQSFDAKEFGASAIQEDDALEKASQNRQSEDCLTLNIWKHSEKKNLPVMVFVHGGSFMHGGTSDPTYSGTNIAKAHDVIVVTFNYRLNIFGFVNFGLIDPAFGDSGHLGMSDQIAAIRWVKENIAEFGGNPDNITVFGESAGSISTFLLTITPAARGLFQKAIPESGPTRFVQDSQHAALLLEDFLQLSGTRKMSDLMQKSSAELRDIYVKLFEMRRDTAHSDYLPACDGKFWPADPFTALRNGAARGIKFMTGTTADEWGYWQLYDENYFADFHETHEKISPVMKRYKEHTGRTDRELYREWLQNRPDTPANYREFINQMDWRVGQELDAENQSKYEDVYYYLFSETTERKELGSFHGLELGFVFGAKPEESWLMPNQNLVRQIQASWTAFAATGSPNNELIPHWEKYSAGSRNTMELNSKGWVCHKDLNTENLNKLRYIYES